MSVIGEAEVIFISNIFSIACDVCKSILIDVNLLKYKPSVLAACALFLGFQLQFEINMNERRYDLDKPAGREAVGKIAHMFCVWRNILEQALEMDGVSKMMQFCSEILRR